MPILPIDAQTLFSQIDQVGKEQAAQRESTPQAQSLQGAALARRAEHADHSVGEAREPAHPRSRDLGSSEPDEGAEKVLDEQKGGGRREGRPRKQGREAPPAEGEAERFADPDLGRHVDLLG